MEKIFTIDDGEQEELTDSMISRLDDISNSIYNLCLLLLQVPPDECDTQFPWNIGIISEIQDSVSSVLKSHGFEDICYPYISYDETGDARRCYAPECGCIKCNLR